ncbi:MAG: hypothetical protein WAW67_02540, partial [Candidatus Omnitrophota bacterium]
GDLEAGQKFGAYLSWNIKDLEGKPLETRYFQSLASKQLKSEDIQALISISKIADKPAEFQIAGEIHTLVSRDVLEKVYKQQGFDPGRGEIIKLVLDSGIEGNATYDATLGAGFRPVNKQEKFVTFAETIATKQLKTDIDKEQALISINKVAGKKADAYLAGDIITLVSKGELKKIHEQQLENNLKNLREAFSKAGFEDKGSIKEIERLLAKGDLSGATQALVKAERMFNRTGEFNRALKDLRIIQVTDPVTGKKEKISIDEYKKTYGEKAYTKYKEAFDKIADDFRKGYREGTLKKDWDKYIRDTDRSVSLRKQQEINAELKKYNPKLKIKEDGIMGRETQAAIVFLQLASITDTKVSHPKSKKEIALGDYFVSQIKERGIKDVSALNGPEWRGWIEGLALMDYRSRQYKNLQREDPYFRQEAERTKVTEGIYVGGKLSNGKELNPAWYKWAEARQRAVEYESLRSLTNFDQKAKAAGGIDKEKYIAGKLTPGQMDWMEQNKAIYGNWEIQKTAIGLKQILNPDTKKPFYSGS